MVEAWAVRVGDEIDVTSVYPTERGAKVNWLGAGEQNHSRVMVLATFPDDVIEALWLATAEPQGAFAVPVTIEPKATH